MRDIEYSIFTKKKAVPRRAARSCSPYFTIIGMNIAANSSATHTSATILTTIERFFGFICIILSGFLLRLYTHFSKSARH